MGFKNFGRTSMKEIARRLEEMGLWLKENGESIYGTRGGPFKPAKWGCSTHKGNTIFVHILKGERKSLKLPPLDRSIKSAKRMDGRKVRFTQNDSGITCEHQVHDDTTARGMIDNVFGFAGGKTGTGERGECLELSQIPRDPGECERDSCHAHDQQRDEKNHQYNERR